MQSLPSVLENEAISGLAEIADRAEPRFASERTDKQLVDSVVAGDNFAFEQLFDRYKRYVANVAGRYLVRNEDIEEAVQIAFAKAFFELPKFRGEHTFSLNGWLRRITVNVCIDILRSRKRKPEELCCDLTDGDISSLERLGDREQKNGETNACDRDLAEKLLGNLNAEDRALLQMLYVEEMSVAEIGEVFDWSHSKVKIRAWRARRSLKKILARYV